MNAKNSLTPRLALCARLADGADTLCDVGTDHGYLPISLVKRGAVSRAVAADIRPGPLASARRHAAEAGLEDRIRFELADGLGFPGAEECGTVVCAGMGGETIAGILERAPWTRAGTRLILQPQSKLDELCEWLRENGYALVTAALAAEGERLYIAMLVHGGSEGPLWAEDALAASGDPLLGEWLEWRIRRLERALAGMERAKDAAEEYARARRTLERLRAYREGGTI